MGRGCPFVFEREGLNPWLRGSGQFPRCRRRWPYGHAPFLLCHPDRNLYARGIYEYSWPSSPHRGCIVRINSSRACLAKLPKRRYISRRTIGFRRSCRKSLARFSPQMRNTGRPRRRSLRGRCLPNRRQGDRHTDQIALAQVGPEFLSASQYLFVFLNTLSAQTFSETISRQFCYPEEN